MEQLLSNQEYILESTQRVSSTTVDPDVAEELLKKHESFVSTMSSVDERVDQTLQEAERLKDNKDADKIQERVEKVDERRKKNKADAADISNKLRVS